MERTINLPAATFLIVGYVVGATIFILPGSLAEQVGPSVYLAYALAAIPASVACVVMAVIGSAIPSNGSIYLLIRDVLSPTLGFLYLWLMVSLSAVVIPLVAFGFADYFSFFELGFNAKAVGLGVIVLVIAMNYLGMQIASRLQSIMVIGFVLALVVFAIGGLDNGDIALLQPMFPKGLAPIMVAATTAYFSYAGVFVIAEVAGEIKNPKRTIPWAIFLSFVVIVLLYTLVPLALSSVLPWQNLADTPMPVVTASRQFLPAWAVSFISIGALLAAATSINGILMGLSRDFYRGAESGLFPRYFAGIHPRFGTPARAVLVVGALALAGVLVGGGIVQFAQIAVIGLMLVQIMTGIALFRLPKKLPQIYAASPFKLSVFSLRLIAAFYVAVSLAFLLLLVLEQPGIVLPGTFFLAAGLAAHYLGGRRGGTSEA